jgi:hypothetical protein
MPSIKVRSVEEVVLAGLNNIKTHFRILGNKAGWHQYLGSEKIGNIATSQALLLLDEFGVGFDKKYLAVENIIKSQTISKGDKARDGGWAYVTNFASMPSSEATCWALLALHKENRNSNFIKRGINWLLQNQVEGLQDEGWGTIKTDKSRVYTTCLVLKTLKAFNYEHSPQFERGLNYLINSQNSDGGWGEKFGFASSITHTSHAVIGLVDIINSPNSQIIKRGVDWLNKNFIATENDVLKNGGYHEIIEFDCDINGVNTHQRLTYYHLPVPYALIALLKTGNINNKNVFWGFNQLINNNNDGYWFHPHLNDLKVKPLWAIYDVLMSFKELKKISVSWVDSLEIMLSNNKVIFVKKGRPFDKEVFVEKFVKGIWGKIFIIIVVCILSSYIFDWIPALEGKKYMQIVLIPLIAELLGYYLIEVHIKK